jgi:UDP-N-acetylglucosamine--N-acetylmuramyl-(pentapeptide) pyrophosphoryl-undecaprenol N-acetylglucosamine transferase
MSSKQYRIIISGGGTGGHIFPAIAIANAIKSTAPDCEILFVGAERRMEMEKVPAAGYKIIGLPIAGLQRKKIWKNFSVLTKLVRSLSMASKIIESFKPDAVIGVGGYASGPVLWKASRSNVPVFIQEQNSYAGLTNKLLARKARKIFVAYEGMERYFAAEKIIITGNPVRQDISDIATKRDEAIKFFDLDSSKKTILFIGGSLGARTLNESIKNGLSIIEESNIQLIWQSGGLYYKEAQALIANYKGKNIRLIDFIKCMDLAYAASDVVISRAGALSISELCLAGKPAILVPSPNVAEDHQMQNALALTMKDAAILVKDNEARVTLIKTALWLVENDIRCAQLSINISKLAISASAEKIAEIILSSL